MRNSGRFRVSEVRHSVDLSHLKWSVDSKADLEFVRAINERLRTNGCGNLFTMDDVLRVLDFSPDLSSINQVSYRGEGLYHSIAKDPPIPATELKINGSEELSKRSHDIIRPFVPLERLSTNQFPSYSPNLYIIRGEGSHVWDADDNEYIDYPLDSRAVPLGHNHPRVTEAVIGQMKDAVAVSFPQKLELELAELLIKILPYAEMVQFSTSEAEAVNSALGIARALTGRNLIAECGYLHQAISFRYNDVSSLEQIFDRFPNKVAAVIMEPIGIEEPKERFLFDVRAITNQNGALLIFNETITGFRFDLSGTHTQVGVPPDIACFGKSMANGYPISAVVGHREVMGLSKPSHQGNALSIAAALATIDEIQQSNVIPHIWGQGRKLKDGFNTLARYFEIDEYFQCTGFAPRTAITFKDETGAESPALRSLFQQECLKRGLLFSTYHNPGFSHSDQDIDHTLRTYRTVLENLGQVINEKGSIGGRISELIDPIARDF